MYVTKTAGGRLLKGMVALSASLVSLLASATAPGIAGTGGGGAVTFELQAAPAYITQPDGNSVYSWGYGCNTGWSPGAYLPGTVSGGACPAMQLPGPTLIVHQNDMVTVTLHNNLPAAAGNTSILFPGFDVSYSGGSQGLLTKEAAHGGAVTYTFKADSVGTHAYYSGTQGDLQIEMGLYGAIIVLPSLEGSPAGPGLPANYSAPTLSSRQSATCHVANGGSEATLPNGDPDYRLSSAAYNHSSACYDREYLFQFSEMDPAIHQQAQEQKDLACQRPTGCMTVVTEPYVPAYFLINGRSMPDLMDPNYALQYPHQPYNGNPHMHPGELVLLRVIGTGRWQHPFHEHGNHVRVLARDGNQLLTSTNKLAGPLLFTTTTTPGEAMDGIFQWTGKGLNWDAYGHTGQMATCVPDANGYYTTGSGALATAPNYFEWCEDHNKPLESKPFGNVGSGGPVTLPDANIFALGAWYGGSPYLGPDATARAVGTTPIPPSGTVANSPTDEAGFSFMWHSHNEREITTNNAFPGGMMMMMLVDPWTFLINEQN